MSNDQSSAPVIWEQKFKHLTLRHCEPSHWALASEDLESSCRAFRSQRCVRSVLFLWLDRESGRPMYAARNAWSGRGPSTTIHLAAVAPGAIFSGASGFSGCGCTVRVTIKVTAAITAKYQAGAVS